MDDDDNDLDNIFEEYETDDVRPEENAGINEGDANETQTAERVTVPKRIIKNPRLKFNAERLCGERGIPVLVNHFKDVKFKGKGHEMEDLNKLMSTLEHWCHRLYPSMKFEDCLRQIEKLGKKRPVQTCLRKIRMDMPILNSDFIHDEDDERSEEVETELSLEVPPQDAFDRLISETQGASSAQLVSTPLPLKSSTVGYTLGTFGSTLTDEQRKRMEYNKKLAAERRKSKLIATHSSSTDTVSQSHELFAATESSTVGDETSNCLENYPTNEDTISDSASLLAPRTSETLLTSIVEDDSEELELDDLVDLVDEEISEPVRSGNGKDKSNSSQSIDFHNNTHAELIDLSVVDNGSFANKRCIQVIDIENEHTENTNSLSNQQTEIIHLDEDVNEEFENRDHSGHHERAKTVEFMDISQTELSDGEEAAMFSARTDVASSNKGANLPPKPIELRDESDSFTMDTDETQVIQNTFEVQNQL